MRFSAVVVEGLARLLLGALLLLIGPPLDAQVDFTNVSAAAGVSGDLYSASTGHSLGVVWIDFDVDGLPDLFTVGGGPGFASHLFRNRGDGTFDRADALLPSLPDVELSGARFADYDRDGDPDLFLYADHPVFDGTAPNPPDGPVDLLLRNLWIERGEVLPEGEPLFENAAVEAGLDDFADPPLGDLPGHRSKTAAWLDFDRDGCIDLFVGHFVLNAAGTAANKDRLYRNRCDGTFEDVADAVGLHPGGATRAALAVGGFHLDDDLWPDLYVVNVSSLEPSPDHDDFIYRNNGPDGDGVVTFREVGAGMVGIGDDSQAGMGLDTADLDLDGDWDLYISDLAGTTLDQAPLGNVLYLGDGAGGFLDNSAPQSGVEGSTSWAVVFFDADRDGWEDLFVGTTDKALFRNPGPDLDGVVRFTSTLLGVNGATRGLTRGAAVADYDRDGDLDLATVDENGPLLLFRNDTESAGHWLALELVAGASNLDAIGTVVEATAAGVVRRRQVKGGSSAHSQDEPRVHFGFGEATLVERLRVRWPSGLETVRTQVATDRYLRLVEGEVFADDFESGGGGAWSASQP